MANKKSAIKRAESAKKKTARNKSARSAMQTAIKKYKALIAANKAAEAEKMLPLVISEIDTAAAKGVIHKNSASAKVSDLSKMLSDLKSGKLVIAAKVDNRERARAKLAAAAAEKEKKKAEAKASGEAIKAKRAEKPVKPEKPVKEDRKIKKAAEETAEVRIATKEEKAEEKAKAKEEKAKIKKEKKEAKERGIV